MNRYLTPAEKSRELASWSRSHDLDDPGAREQCDRLNRIEGVCTVQSCIGHEKESKSEPGARYVENGEIEMRLDEARTRFFYAAMPAIRAVTGVDHVEIHWRVHNAQRCTVWFQPGRIVPVVDALVAVLADSGAGARLEPNPGATQEARC